MPIKVEIEKRDLNQQDIDGHDFQLTTFSRNGDEYKINGVTLPLDWDKKVAKTRNSISLDVFCDRFPPLVGRSDINGTVFQDKKTGLVTEANFEFPNTQSSQLLLDTSFTTRSGTYLLKNVLNIHNALLYQNFITRYLSAVCNYEQKYAFINLGCRDYASVDLSIPKDLLPRLKKDVVTDEYFQNIYHSQAIYTTGQFSTELRYIKYNECGLIHIVQIDSQDCHYVLNNGSYYPHNVDNAFQAATLHTIVADFYNKILKRKSSET